MLVLNLPALDYGFHSMPTITCKFPQVLFLEFFLTL